MTFDADVLVAGAGPSGSLAALTLARRGFSVLLVDPLRTPFPRFESLTSDGQNLLHALGLTSILRAATRGGIARTLLSWDGLSDVQEHRRKPLLLDRTSLHKALRSAVLASGVRLEVGTVGRIAALTRGVAVSVRAGQSRDWTARVVIDARGRRGSANALGAVQDQVALCFQSSMDAAPLPSSKGGVIGAEMGVSRRHVGGPWLWWAREAGSGILRGACFLPADRLKGMSEADRLALVADMIATLAPQCGQVTRVSPPLPADVQAEAKIVMQGPILRCGDRSLARDPVTSHGLVHGLRSGVQAAAAAATFLETPEQADAAHAWLAQRQATDREAALRASREAHAPQPDGSTAYRPPVDRDVTYRLNGVPGRVPILAEGRMTWTEGLIRNDRAAEIARLGPLGGDALAHALAEPAPFQECLRRLGKVAPGVPLQSLLPLLDHLIETGWLQPLSDSPS